MAKFTGHRNSVSKEKYKRTENKIEKFKEYVRGRATEKSSAALFRYKNILFIIFNFSIVLFKNNDKIKLLYIIYEEDRFDL